ncbi:MAG: DUF3365 domain-containing protein [Candidatus Wallbacteria bacterium]|nr:DUF3365 domain-containing protein [Candidatus Wallbacteria bacterium]
MLAWILGLPPRVTAWASFLLAAAGLLLAARQFLAASDRLAELRSREQAESLARTILTTRELYAREVADRLRRSSRTAILDFDHAAGTVPLPATFALELGEALEASALREHVRLLSPYPFPWRSQTGGLKDSFEGEAWSALSAGGTTGSFHRVERSGGAGVLRFAAADRMRAACVACHNSHPSSPRKGWKVGELVGLVEIDVPLASASSQAGFPTLWTLVATGALCGGGFALLAIALAALPAARKSAEDARARHEVISRNAACGILSFDEQGTVLTFNPAAERIFGLEAGRAAGTGIDQLLPHCRQAEARAAPGGAFRTGGPWVTRGVRTGGVEVPVELTVTGLVGSDGQTFIALVSDLTQVRKLQEMKDTFIATMTNELKSPLNIMTLAVDTLSTNLAGKLEPRMSMVLEAARSRCHWMIHLVNEVLAYEKIREGQVGLSLKQVELGGLVEQVVEGYRQVAWETGVQMAVACERGDDLVLGDRDQLYRVLENLLSNAVKYSGGGGRVEVRVGGSEARVRVTVADHGQGISDAIRPDIFTRYASAEPEKARLMGSTGLGLSISKAIVTEHGGELGFESEEGKGTRVYFELPRLARTPDRPRGTETAVRAQSDPSFDMAGSPG